MKGIGDKKPKNKSTDDRPLHFRYMKGANEQKRKDTRQIDKAEISK